VASRDGPVLAAAPKLLEELRYLITKIERAATAGIDLTGYVGVGRALVVIKKAQGRPGCVLTASGSCSTRGRPRVPPANEPDRAA
jgi:hypothetical protein